MPARQLHLCDSATEKKTCLNRMLPLSILALLRDWWPLSAQSPGETGEKMSRPLLSLVCACSLSPRWVVSPWSWLKSVFNALHSPCAQLYLNPYTFLLPNSSSCLYTCPLISSLYVSQIFLKYICNLSLIHLNASVSCCLLDNIQTLWHEMLSNILGTCNRVCSVLHKLPFHPYRSVRLY